MRRPQRRDNRGKRDECDKRCSKDPNHLAWRPGPIRDRLDWCVPVVQLLMSVMNVKYALCKHWIHSPFTSVFLSWLSSCTKCEDALLGWWAVAIIFPGFGWVNSPAYLKGFPIVWALPELSRHSSDRHGTCRFSQPATTSTCSHLTWISLHCAYAYLIAFLHIQVLLCSSVYM